MLDWSNTVALDHGSRILEMERRPTPRSLVARWLFLAVIEALKDPEEEVFWAANDALRFISRKVAEARFLSDSTLEASRKRSLAFWTRWCDSLHLEDVRDK
jgi:hypothetical protein